MTALTTSAILTLTDATGEQPNLPSSQTSRQQLLDAQQPKTRLYIQAQLY
jgi:hypothetical protein